MRSSSRRRPMMNDFAFYVFPSFYLVPENLMLIFVTFHKFVLMLDNSIFLDHNDSCRIRRQPSCGPAFPVLRIPRSSYGASKKFGGTNQRENIAFHFIVSKKKWFLAPTSTLSKKRISVIKQSRELIVISEKQCQTWKARETSTMCNLLGSVSLPHFFLRFVGNRSELVPSPQLPSAQPNMLVITI